MFLVDTNVISKARKGIRADPSVIAFCQELARANAPPFLSAITIGELRLGIDLIRHRGDQQQAKAIREAAQLWGRLRAPNPAIALLHDLTVVTRNTTDFAGTGVRLLNPFHTS